MEVSMTVNGTTYTNDVEPRTLLVHYLRENLRLTGTHVGCDTSSCGACTIIANGETGPTVLKKNIGEECCALLFACKSVTGAFLRVA